MSKYLISVLLVAIALQATPAIAKPVYVSDQLTIPMRSGATSQYRIIKFLPSGTALTVMQISEDGSYTQVETQNGNSGWVESKLIMPQQSARDLLVVANKKISQSSDIIVQLKKQMTGLGQQNHQLENKYKNLDSERQALASAYSNLKLTAANPAALSHRNRQLQHDLDQTQTNAAQLEKENQVLQDNVMQNWFLIGGGVSLGSLLIGLLITRVNWRRKRNSWGDSF